MELELQTKLSKFRELQEKKKQEATFNMKRYGGNSPFQGGKYNY